MKYILPALVAPLASAATIPLAVPSMGVSINTVVLVAAVVFTSVSVASPLGGLPPPFGGLPPSPGVAGYSSPVGNVGGNNGILPTNPQPGTLNSVSGQAPPLNGGSPAANAPASMSSVVSNIVSQATPSLQAISSMAQGVGGANGMLPTTPQPGTLNGVPGQALPLNGGSSTANAADSVPPIVGNNASPATPPVKAIGAAAPGTGGSPLGSSLAPYSSGQMDPSLMQILPALIAMMKTAMSNPSNIMSSKFPGPLSF